MIIPSFHYFGMVFLQEKNLLLIREQILSVRIPSKAQGANCNRWNVDYFILPMFKTVPFLKVLTMKSCHIIFDHRFLVSFMLKRVRKYFHTLLT